MEKVQRMVYEVWERPFKDERFPLRLIATCGNRKLARGVIAMNNTAWHGYTVVERPAR